MSKIRTLKPDFFRSVSLASCSIAARLTFAGLWVEADDHGRGRAEPRLLKGVIWPLDDEITVTDILGYLEELSEDHIVLYEVDGNRYYCVRQWAAHQSAAFRRSAGGSKFPPPPGITDGGDEPPPTKARLPLDAKMEADFELAWAAYPKRPGNSRQKALRAYMATRRRGAEAETLLTGTQNYAHHRAGQDPTYTLLAATFFGPDERWKDHLLEQHWPARSHLDPPAVIER